MNNPLVTPELGLIVWTTLVFCILFFLLAKFAWKPILKAVKERENFIKDALNSAEDAKRTIAKLKANNEELLNEARIERDVILKEAREIKEKILAESKNLAKVEAEKIIASARKSIQHEKMSAITDLKNQVAVLSIEIAEKILKDELSSADKQKAIIDNVIKDINLN